MSAVYSGAIKKFLEKVVNQFIVTTDINDLQDETVAIQETLGKNVAGSSTNINARFNDIISTQATATSITVTSSLIIQRNSDDNIRQVGFGLLGKGTSQIVDNELTSTFDFSGTSFSVITGFSTTISMATTTNQALVLSVIGSSGPTGLHNAHFKLLRGDTDINVGNAAGSRARVSCSTHTQEAGTSGAASGVGCAPLAFLDSPGTNGNVTYSIKGAGEGAGNWTINKPGSDTDGADFPRCASSMIIMEIDI